MSKLHDAIERACIAKGITLGLRGRDKDSEDHYVELVEALGGDHLFHPSSRPAARPSPLKALTEQLREVLGMDRFKAPEQVLEVALARLRTSADDIGRDVAPARYTANRRETVDKVRDTYIDMYGPSVGAAAVAFARFCRMTAFIYRDRAGHKGDAAKDLEKAKWWEDMDAHVLNPLGAPDPRAGRPGFVPYTYKGGK